MLVMYTQQKINFEGALKHTTQFQVQIQVRCQDDLLSVL
jgi:hypothetical protein